MIYPPRPPLQSIYLFARCLEWLEGSVINKLCLLDHLDKTNIFKNTEDCNSYIYYRILSKTTSKTWCV